jgi:hypothetical protein
MRIFMAASILLFEILTAKPVFEHSYYWVYRYQRDSGGVLPAVDGLLVRRPAQEATR